MNERQCRDGLKLWRCLLIGVEAVLLAMSLSSCRSVRYVPVEKVVYREKDNVSKDSIHIINQVNTRDSIVKRDSVVYIYNDKGELLRSEIWHWKERYSDVNVLYRELQVKYDSLYSAKQDSVQLPYPVERQLTRWESAKMELGGWAFGGLLFALVIVGWLIYRERIK